MYISSNNNTNYQNMIKKKQHKTGWKIFNKNSGKEK